MRTSLEVTVQGVGEAKSGGHSSHCAMIVDEDKPGGHSSGCG